MSLLLTGLGPASPHVFQASEVPGAYLDWDSSTVSGNDGDPIALVTDSFGNGRNAIQNTANRKPTLKVAERNGKNILRCNSDANPKCMESANFSPAVSTPVTVIAAFKCNDTNDEYMCGSNSINIFARRGPLDGSTWRGGSALSALIQGGHADTNWHVGVFQHNGVNSFIRIDGVVIATGNAGTDPWDNFVMANHRPSLGSLSHIDIGRLTMYAAAVSDINIARLERLFRAQWGLTDGDPLFALDWDYGTLLVNDTQLSV